MGSSLCHWHTLQIYSSTSTTWTLPFREQRRTWSELGKAYLSSLINFQSALVAFDQATTLIFHNLMKLQKKEKYRYSSSLKYKSICRYYDSPSSDTFVQERFLIHRVGCSRQDPVIFNLKSTVWMTMMAWRKIKLKWKPVEKLKSSSIQYS